MGISEKIVCLVALAMGLVGHYQAKGQPQLNEPSLELTVWVENWAEVSPVTLSTAQNAASKLFRRAGVQVNWHTISAPALAPQPVADTSLVLRILESKDAGFPEPSLGFRWQRGPDDVRAIVFTDRIEQFARRSSARSETAAILGCAMVHDLGHLLLGKRIETLTAEQTALQTQLDADSHYKLITATSTQKKCQ
jgi:hypothetical protein